MLFFWVDLMLRDDLEQLIDGRLEPQGVQAVLRAADMLRWQVQRVLGHPLPEVVREAITALNLDIDMLLAGICVPIMPMPRLTPPTWRSPSPIDAVMKLVDTYMQEIASQGTPSLRAFISSADSLRDAREENAVAPDVPVDVVLMTVHQSKGLEWDAVAVVGMTDGGFPATRATI